MIAASSGSVSLLVARASAGLGGSGAGVLLRRHGSGSVICAASLSNVAVVFRWWPVTFARYLYHSNRTLRSALLAAS